MIVGIWSWHYAVVAVTWLVGESVGTGYVGQVTQALTHWAHAEAGGGPYWAYIREGWIKGGVIWTEES